MNNQLIEELYKTIEAKDKIINEQALEIARLDRALTTAIDTNERLYQRINKAIDYIKENDYHYMNEYA